MTSLILPKLIRSDDRDDMLSSSYVFAAATARRELEVRGEAAGSACLIQPNDDTKPGPRALILARDLTASFQFDC